MRRELVVVAALIKVNDKIFLCRRCDNDAYGGLWEFPGGAVEKGESLEQAIEREICEELGLEVKANALMHNLTDEDGDLKINIFLYKCDIKKGKPQTLECQDFGFFTIEEAKSLKLAPADIKILNFLSKELL